MTPNELTPDLAAFIKLKLVAVPIDDEETAFRYTTHPILNSVALASPIFIA
jgi:hypothetical protein